MAYLIEIDKSFAKTDPEEMFVNDNLVGALCYFWNDGVPFNKFVIDTPKEKTPAGYKDRFGRVWKHCKPIVIGKDDELYVKKDNKNV